MGRGDLNFCVSGAPLQGWAKVCVCGGGGGGVAGERPRSVKNKIVRAWESCQILVNLLMDCVGFNIFQ